MSRLQILPLAAGDRASADAVIALWRACDLTRPWNDPEADLDRAVKGPASAVVVARDGPGVVGSAMVGHDGHRGAVYYLAVAPDRQKHGIGRLLMDAVEAWLAASGAPKLNLMVRPENHAVAAFYRALGYEVEERIVLAKRLGESPSRADPNR